MNILDFPDNLNAEISVRQIAKIIPEISRMFSLNKLAYVNFAIYSPNVIFADNEIPKIKSNLDFTFYVKDFEENFKQIFTCKSDLVFDILLKNSGDFNLNWSLGLSKVMNFEMSNDFTYIDMDYMRYVIEEIVKYGLKKNGGALLSKDLDLSV